MEQLKCVKQGVRLFAAACLSLCLAAGGIMPGAVLESKADYVDISGNHFVHTDKAPSGKTGKIINMSLIITNYGGAFDEDENIYVSFSPDNYLRDDPDDTIEDGSNWRFPFEADQDMFSTRKKVGKLKENRSRTISLSARVRRDLADGYYPVKIRVEGEFGGVEEDWINVWVKKSTDTKDDEEEEGTIDIVLGEGQSTPNGVYPHVMNFSINMRNACKTDLYDVTAILELSEDDEKYPFEINDINYDRRFEKLPAGESVSLDYSMAIRKDTYTGYYPIKTTIYYRDSSNGTGELAKLERSFFVRIHNKDKEDDLGEFDKNDRKMARLIVDSYETIPKEVYAGQEFELILRMKNASSDITASNILFTMESEKVSESAVFTMESGSSSMTVNRMGPGEVSELRMKMVSGAGVDQRSYALTINETYDSPEFKNAEEKVSIDIPVKQEPRMNVGTFEIMPDSITVGGESNIMFPINNTGKVTLYNVMARFEADSINPAESYVGNIKSGETGNVDAMLTAIAPTMDDGTIKLTITYEDVNGVPSTLEKTFLLTVSEEEPMNMEDFGMEDMEGMAAEVGFFGRHKTAVKLGAVLAAAGAVAAGILIRLQIKKKKKRQEEEERELEEREEEREIGDEDS
ncbi:CARDB domain-containing protein [Lachnospiraceae bacterium 62-35]